MHVHTECEANWELVLNFLSHLRKGEYAISGSVQCDRLRLSGKTLRSLFLEVRVFYLKIRMISSLPATNKKIVGKL